MKKFLFFTIFFCLFFQGIYAAPFKKNQKMYVTVNQTTLKSSNSMFAKIVHTISYGDEVLLLNEKGTWIEVALTSNKKIKGWIPLSALTSKKIVLNTRGKNTVSASSKELALAGKGFNQEVENIYGKNKKVDYTLIDKMETDECSLDELYEFISEGNLMRGAQ